MLPRVGAALGRGAVGYPRSLDRYPVSLSYSPGLLVGFDGIEVDHLAAPSE